MSNDLIKWLRDEARYVEVYRDAEDGARIREAADALQAAAEREAKALSGNRYAELEHIARQENEKLRAEVARLGEEYRNAASDNFKFASRIKALEEGLSPFVNFFDRAMEGFTEGYAERVPPEKPAFGWNNAYLLMQDFLEARQLLNGASDA